MQIDKIDKNLEVKVMETADGFNFYDVCNKPIELYGLLYEKEDGSFVRLPGKVSETVNEGVHGLRLHNAGGRVRFRTDSKKVAVKAFYRNPARMAHMPLTGHSGLDIYENDVYARTFIPSYDVTTEFMQEKELYVEGVRDITINFPLYNGLTDLYVGLEEGAQLLPPTPYAYDKPIVYYGSSITQGGCASRPGNAYQAILSRMLNCDHVNLGFSGSARGEETMARYIASLDMLCFVMDYDHNAPTAEHLEATHYPFYRIIREAHPELPIVMMNRPDTEQVPEITDRRRNAVYATYQRALAEGDKNVYFVEGQDLFGKEGRDSCTVDGCHPNDLGFWRMAECLRPVLEGILKKL